MFPESKWVVNDVINQYIPDEDDQRLFRSFLDELNLDDSLEDIRGVLDRLERATESSNQEPDSQEPVIEDSPNQEPVVEESVEQEPVVEESEQKKVDTSESKLQKLLENILKK